jgi:hypothetical protein
MKKTLFSLALAVAVASVAALGAIWASGGPHDGPHDLFAVAALAMVCWASTMAFVILGVTLR